MATYKVIQDIEAEDKFVGPLTLKQFIFGSICALFLWLSFFALTHNAAVLLAVFMPFALLGGFLAVPWSSTQSTEIWVLAKVRFLLKPRVRLWNQSGIQELVKITVPKKIEKPLTKDLSEGEVTSRLKALAQTIDSRGWAIKNATLATSQMDDTNYISDRLVTPSVPPAQVPEVDLANVPDVLDSSSNFVAQNLEQMMRASADIRKDQMRAKMDRIRRGEPIELSDSAHARGIVTGQVPNIQQKSIEEQVLSQQLRQKNMTGNLAYEHMRTVRSQDKARPNEANNTDTKKAQAAMTTPSSPDIISLAGNDDLNITTISREAKRSSGEQTNPTEVVIPLH